MLFADLGAEVMKVERTPLPPKASFYSPAGDVMNRGRPSVAIDLKRPAGVDTLLRLIEGAHALIDPYRPGVMERLGLAPDVCLARNPRLVYGRITGWGQQGPYAKRAGHDINYIGIDGVLSLVGREGEAPVPPINLVGDFGGGGMLLAVGILAAMLEARESGRGQVVDAAMIDGAALLSTVVHGLRGTGHWHDQRGTNLLDTGAPFYDVYATADGGHMAVGAIEPQFYTTLMATLGLEGDPLFADQMDQAHWPAMKGRLAGIFASRSRAEWEAAFDGVEACVTPVLNLDEAAADAHIQARSTFIEVAGIRQPAPAPRFSRTPGAVVGPPAEPGEHTRSALVDWGLQPAEVEDLLAAGVVVDAARLVAGSGARSEP
jgi:alpha-methylacyl-CoA racemase